MVQSRQGADLAPAFPDLAAAATALRDDNLVLDGELVVPLEGRLDFGELQRRARRRGRSAVRAAKDRPAYLITFDVLQASGSELLKRPYRERRARLENPFANAPGAAVPATAGGSCASTAATARTGCSLQRRGRIWTGNGAA